MIQKRYRVGKQAREFAPENRNAYRDVYARTNLYSLAESMKANGLEPYAYLREVFIRLPGTDTVDDVEALPPFHVASAQTRS